jgi:energy-coupling factor transporter ATP-binding protein EcfA2
MRILRLTTSNYRTLQDITLTFRPYFTAICGRNDSGKTNVVRAIRSLMRAQDPFFYREDPQPSIAEDFTKWVSVDPKDKRLAISIDLSIDPVSDKALHEFVRDYLGLPATNEELALTIETTHQADVPPEVVVCVGDNRFEDLKAQEVLKRVQTSRTFLFHSSVSLPYRFIGRYGYGAVVGALSEEQGNRLRASQDVVNKALKKIAREQGEEIEDLLGRLRDRYKVGLSFPSFDLADFPYDLTLGDRKVDVELEQWGSGTRNRTLVLLTLFRAKQIAESTDTSSKVTPVIVVEEPESFLHPLAQAEFGRVLQDLAEEFRVQTIVTTHSPYLLSQRRPDANILLERRLIRRQVRDTVVVDTSGERWMEPFALSLGVRDREFVPWRNALFSSTGALLLVEGEIDKRYFDLLRDPLHGDNALHFDGDIFPYGGKDALRNQALLKFIRDKFAKLFITYDLDADNALRRPLEALGFERRVTYSPVGVDAPGKRSIEGFLPDSVRTAVYAAHPDLVQALGGSAEERRDANEELKGLLFEQFAREAQPGDHYFGRFYQLTKLINRAVGAGA